MGGTVRGGRQRFASFFLTILEKEAGSVTQHDDILRVNLRTTFLIGLWALQDLPYV